MRLKTLVQRTHNVQVSVYHQSEKTAKGANRIRLIEISLTIMDNFLDFTKAEGEKDQTLGVLRGLVDRARKSLQSTALLAFGGYEIPSLSMIRDIIEIQVL